MSPLFDLSGGPKNLIEVLLERSQKHPDRMAQVFLPDGQQEGETFTFGELELRVRSVAAELQSRYSKGDRAILMYPPGLEFVVGYMSCIFSAIVPIPVYPPHPLKPQQDLQGLLNIVNDSRPNLILSQSGYLLSANKIFENIPEISGLKWECTDFIASNPANSWKFPEINGDSTAFIQYTSGSTRNARGVVITHDNLFHNLSCIYHYFGHSPQSQGVIWLPPYHDMGLIGGILQPIFGGFPVTLMPPLAFIQQPVRWLNAITKYKATSSGGPNFGYEYCVSKIGPKQLAELDLSSWEVAFNGAEPINPKTVRDFCNYFKPCGFRPESFYSCYGLAESTLIVTGIEKSASPTFTSYNELQLEDKTIIQKMDEGKGKQQKVGCGKPVMGMEVRIVNPATAEVYPDGTIGEIWVKGPSVAHAYYNRPEESAYTFNAVTAGDVKGPFLRTGDLGFMLEGELFVTGRIKDVIIINGTNYYAQDIEWTVEQSHPSIRNHAAAAFSIEEEGKEHLVIVLELDTNYIRKQTDFSPELTKEAIISAVSLNHQIEIHDIVLLQSKRLPKTSSGKIKRHAVRAAYCNGFHKDTAVVQ